jgi:hypothetical protein
MHSEVQRKSARRFVSIFTLTLSCFSCIAVAADRAESGEVTLPLVEYQELLNQHVQDGSQNRVTFGHFEAHATVTTHPSLNVVVKLLGDVSIPEK